jgi:hypothetical protein
MKQTRRRHDMSQSFRKSFGGTDKNLIGWDKSNRPYHLGPLFIIKKYIWTLVKRYPSKVVFILPYNMTFFVFLAKKPFFLQNDFSFFSRIIRASALKSSTFIIFNVTYVILLMNIIYTVNVTCTSSNVQSVSLKIVKINMKCTSNVM